MDQCSLDSAINLIEMDQEWLKAGCVAGNSPAVFGFMEQLSDANSLIDESSGSVVVCLERTCDSEILENGLANALFFQDVHVVNLHTYAPIFNECLLFGNGPEYGVFERTKQSIVIRNVDCLSESAFDRLCIHMQVWLVQTRRRVLLTTRPGGLGGDFDSSVGDSVATVVIQLPSLQERLADLPFIVHHAATRNGGGLDHFTLDAMNQLEHHHWSFGVGEVEEVVRELYLSIASSDGACQFTGEDVRTMLERVGQQVSVPSHISAAKGRDTQSLWADLNANISEVDLAATNLIGQPFFSHGVITSNSDPARLLSPELGFSRLVSWSYVTIVENAEPNLRCVLRLFSGQHLDDRRVKAIREAIVCLRTFLQHSLRHGSEHDQLTLNRTYAWFEKTIGRRQPENRDFEACIRGLLLDCHDLVDDLLQFLRKVGRDDFRDMVIQQWQKLREGSWPKHRFETIVKKALQELRREDLDASAVCSQNLKGMQEILAATAESQDRDSVVYSFIERKVCERYPLKLPVNGRDLIDLGVKPGPQIGTILEALREKFEVDRLQREDLLSEARRMIERDDTDAAHGK